MPTIEAKIVGVSYPNKDGRSRQAVLAWCEEGDDLTLEAEPDNKFDKNAIKVMSHHGQIGYLSRDVALECRSLTFPRPAKLRKLEPASTTGNRKAWGLVKFNDEETEKQ